MGSDQLNANDFSTEIKVVPKVKYFFQVMAIERYNKSSVNWEKSEKVEFKTSNYPQTPTTSKPVTTPVYRSCSLKDPGFNSTPIVVQVDIQTVRVSWDGIITQIECVANFIVKYWQEYDLADYELSDQLNANDFSTEIKVVPKVKYFFQVMAIERYNKSSVNWEKSEKVEFKTSNYPQTPTTSKPVTTPVYRSCSLKDPGFNS